jgi:hypothetical protein
VGKNFAVLDIFFMGYLERPPLHISHEKYIKDAKVLFHLGFTLKVLPGSLTDLSA